MNHSNNYGPSLQLKAVVGVHRLSFVFGGVQMRVRVQPATVLVHVHVQVAATKKLQ